MDSPIDKGELDKMLDEVNASLAREDEDKAFRSGRAQVQRLLDTYAKPQDGQPAFPANLGSLLWLSIEAQPCVVNYLQARGVDLANDDQRISAILDLLRSGAESMKVEVQPAVLATAIEKELGNDGNQCTCDLQRGTEHEGYHHPECPQFDGHN